MTAIVESSILKIVIDKISSPILSEFGLLWGLTKDLSALESKIETIKDVLQEANKHDINNMPVYNWLRKLKDVVYDADDLLEKFRMEAEFSRCDIHGATKKAVYAALSEINLPKRLKMAHKIRKLNERLQAIADERKNFIIEKTNVQESNVGPINRKTWSMVDEKAVLGRDSDKSAIINELIRTDCQESISIMSIVGLGGIGKTTLAQVVYNDETEVKNHFKLRMWVHVSENFNVEAILRTMIHSVTGLNSGLGDLDFLGKEMAKAIREIRFLLVLDDVWDPDQEMWEKLKLVLENGSKESRIIVTTRMERVADQMKSRIKFLLKGLPLDVCMNMFTQRVFGGSLNSINTQIAEIAKEMVNKCGGNPLAVKHLGNFMQSKQGVDAWLAVRNSEIWKLPGDANNVVITTLKLSYMHLPLALKECFTYCSILPKGGQINKDELIGQWIAHGMIPMMDGDASMEVIGNGYFNDLLQMSFLQDPVKDENTEVVTCRMHDLVHDLAKSNAGDELYITTHAGAMPTSDLHKTCRYLCLVDCKQEVHMSIMKRARGLHIYKGDFIIDNGISETSWFIKKKKVKCLRTLVLHPVSSIPFPMSITKLKMLRYLWISKLKCRELPEAICSLWSLQSLHVKDCEQLQGLPNDVGKLRNLRTLDLSWCGSLETLPVSIGSCQSLQNLILRGCRIITSLPISLCQLENLRVLNLSCCNGLENFPADVLEKFKDLRNLNLYYCRSITELPSSIGNLQNLQTLNLLECSKIQQLPMSLGTLRCIESINLSTCNIKELPDSVGNLVNLRILNLSSCQALISLPESISNLQRLRSLFLRGTKLSTLPQQISKLVNLESLGIEQCSHLRQLPEGLVNMPKLNNLMNKGCWSLCNTPRGIGKLTHLQQLHMFVLDRDNNYASLSELENLDLLSDELNIRNIRALKSLSEAKKAQLERKQNLEELTLEWGGKGMATDLSLEVLNCLRPNKNIKRLIISNYPGSTYPKWMMVMENNTSPFPYLTFMELRGVKCTTLPHVDFPHLKDIFINNMNELVSIKGQHFPSLRGFTMYHMPKLCFWSTIVEEEQKSSHPKPAYPRLFRLSIWNCPKLEVHPFVPPSVELIELDSSNEALLRDPNFSEPSSSTTHTYYTKKLSIFNITSSSGWKLLHHLHLLNELCIENCSNLDQLPHSLKHLSSLHELKVDNCENLNDLPKWLGELQSLQRLTIGKCPGLKSLPDSISRLTNLKWLVLDDCAVLGGRCTREIGEDWHLISHVPLVFIY